VSLYITSAAWASWTGKKEVTENAIVIISKVNGNFGFQ